MSYIEVERKVRLNEKNLSRIESLFTFIEEISFEDIYYDSVDYRLTTTDRWLRKRGKRFELKVRVGETSAFDCYREIVDEDLIKKELDLPAKEEICEGLKQQQFLPFCHLVTNRKKMKWKEYTIDLDVANFGDFVYPIAEIEILVKHPDEIAQAESKISQLADLFEINLNQQAVSKIEMFMFQRLPAHYNALVKAGVIQPMGENE